MSRNYSKLIKLAKFLSLPAWVLISFYAAQSLVVSVFFLLKNIGLPLSSFNDTVVNTTVAAILYVVTLVITIGLPWIIKKKRTTLADVGLIRLPSWSDILLTPVALVFYLIMSSLFILAATNLLPWVDITQVQNTGFSSITARYEYILAFLTLVVIAPIAEEILFRGYLLSKLKKIVPIWAAILTTSILFGFIHGAWNVAIDTFALSLVLCYLRESTGSLWASILLHMAKNGIAFYVLFINPSLFSILR